MLGAVDPYAPQGNALSQAELKPYTPSWSERFGSGAQDLMSHFGASLGYAQQFGQNARDLAGFVPGLGNALSANDAYRNYQGGDYLGAALSGLGAIPLPGAALAGDAERLADRGILAYHGSPHSFDQFDMGKIGTGEGAQAYGHGLYFAQNEDTARSYRYMQAPAGQDARGSKIVNDALTEARGAGLDGDAARKYAMDLLDQKAKGPPSWAPRQAYYDALNNFDALSGGPGAAGSMYHVNIRANPEHFLDWDKPLSEQSAHVQRAVDLIATEKLGHAPNYDRLAQAESGAGIHGWLSALTNYGGREGQQAASAALNAAGVPGIRYLDQGSRAAGNGSHNYVVFDANMINILKKYGLAGLGMAGGASALSQSQSQDAGYR